MAGRSLNKVMLIGHLGKDPELRYTPNGSAVASFGVATNRSYVDQASGEKKRLRADALRRISVSSAENVVCPSKIRIT